MSARAPAVGSWVSDDEMSSSAPPRVLIVGSGPTGLTAANLLGSMGIPVRLVERHAGTSDAAKAISLDDESMRFLQLADLDEAVRSIIVPGTGTKYFGARGQELMHARGAESYRFGHPFKNPFAQPEFEQVLRQGLDRFPHVQQSFATTLVRLDDRGDGVHATLRSSNASSPNGTGPNGTGPNGTGPNGTGPGDHVDLSVDYVLGCDGGRSTVRQQLGIEMTGRGFDEPWLVADTLGDPHDERYGMHFGNPDRPCVIVPGRDGRCRYEFLLHPGEGEPAESPPFELVRDLVRPFRPLAPEQVERAVTYRFNALLANRLRSGRCFLLGDAAHMMPPFAGQGLNSGLRDAVNLSWKLAAVLTSHAEDRLLDTYETERRAHARAVIDHSVLLGRVVMTTDRRRAIVRDFIVSAAMRTRRGRRYLTEMRYRPTPRIDIGALARLLGHGNQELVGLALPQPRVLHGTSHALARLDDVLGAGWSLLGINVCDADWSESALARLPAHLEVDVVLDDRSARPRAGRQAVADADGRLDTLLGRLRGHFVLVRPDRVVAAAFAPAAAGQVVDGLAAAGLAPASPREPPPGTRVASVEGVRPGSAA